MSCSGLRGDSSLQDCPWNLKHRLPLAVCPWLLLRLLTYSSIYSDFLAPETLSSLHSFECTNTRVRSPGQFLWPFFFFFQKRKTGKNYLPQVMQVLKGNKNLQACSQPKCSSFWPSLLSEATGSTLALCRQLGRKLESEPLRQSPFAMALTLLLLLAQRPRL